LITYNYIAIWEINFQEVITVKQIILSIAMLAIALAIVSGVIVPLFEHGAEEGERAGEQGGVVYSRLSNILK